MRVKVEPVGRERFRGSKGNHTTAVANHAEALEAALAQIEKVRGKGSVMRLEEDTRLPIDVVPTGGITSDVALGISGLPRGRIVEIYGSGSSDKTTVAFRAIANAQAESRICAFIDTKHALDPDYTSKLDVNTDELLVSQPDNGEQALEITDTLVHSGALTLIVIDSVAVLTSRVEIEDEMGNSHVSLQACLVSQALRKVTGALKSTNTTAIFINQLREEIGVMFDSSETTTGDRALKFYSSVRPDIKKIETLKDNSEMVGSRTRMKVVKSKVAPPFEQAEFGVIYGGGISRKGSLIDMGVANGIIRKAGAWLTCESGQLGRGKENARNFLENSPKIAGEIDRRIRATFDVVEQDVPEGKINPEAGKVEVTS